MVKVFISLLVLSAALLIPSHYLIPFVERGTAGEVVITVLFFAGALSGGMSLFTLFGIVLSAMTDYEHQPERDRVDELNRHIDQQEYLNGMISDVFMQNGRTIPVTSPAGKQIGKLRSAVDADTKRFMDTTLNEIMPRHDRAEMRRDLIVTVFMVLFVCGGCTFIAVAQIYLVK